MKKESKLCSLLAAPADGGRIFRNGLYSTAILAAAVVLVILINLMCRRSLPNTLSSICRKAACIPWGIPRYRWQRA